jgi:hypothetical protein
MVVMESVKSEVGDPNAAPLLKNTILAMQNVIL